MNEILNFKEFEIRALETFNVEKYVSLLRECFPSFKVSYEYISWLYFKNPSGPAIGYDAFLRGELVAHYACIPIGIAGFNTPALLSVNTATSPRFQGRGLFKVLALNTYSQAEEAKFSFVVGVANRNSFKSFTRHLGFTHLGNLELRFGFLSRPKVGSRVYSKADLEWRSSSPLNEFKYGLLKDSSSLISVRFLGPIRLRSVVPTGFATGATRRAWNLGLTIDWRKEKRPIFFLPARFKPSPLALIIKPLNGSDSSTLSSWSFPDFDAY